jgi:hypothetical protein
MSIPFIQTGVWVDQNRSLVNREYLSFEFKRIYERVLTRLECQILLSDYRAGILTNAIAVLITSTLKPVFELLRAPFWLLWQKVTSRWGLLRPTAVEEAQNFYEMMGEVLRATVQELQERCVHS